MPNKKSTILIFILVVLGLLFLHYLGPLTYLEDKILKLLNPLAKNFFSWQAKISDRESTQKINIDSLRAENEILKNQINQLIIENTELKKYQTENEELREILNFTKERQLNYLVAHIINQTTNNLSQTVLIDKGTNHGVQIGQAVITSEGLLLGKIIAVTNNTATFRLITDTQSTIAAYVLNNKQAQGIVKGQHQLSLILDLVPQDQKLKTNQIILTSSLDQKVPADLIIGTITEVITQSGDLFQKAIIKPQANFNNLQIVTIIIE